MNSKKRILIALVVRKFRVTNDEVPKTEVVSRVTGRLASEGKRRVTEGGDSAMPGGNFLFFLAGFFHARLPEPHF